MRDQVNFKHIYINKARLKPLPVGNHGNTLMY